MNMKSIVIWVIIVIAILIGGYIVYQNMGNGTGTPADQAAGAAGTDQVQGQDVVIGTGAEATPGSTVSVLYTGALEDGTVFDSSEAHNNEPLVFTLGDQNLIAGFQIGINGMKVGGERQIAIPSSLGYGTDDVKDADGNVLIPAGSTLYFDIKLVNVEAPSTDSTAPAGDSASTDTTGEGANPAQ